MPDPLLVPTSDGIYCPAGDFYIDPSAPVPRAVVTHAHGDHASGGAASILCAPGSAPLLARRQPQARLQPLPHAERLRIGDVTVSLHPAGHMLGAAQVRVEKDGDVWVAAGDYKRDKDPTCEAFELVPCRVFITETTFGLPVFRWPDPTETVAEIEEWRMRNAESGRTSLLLAYPAGKGPRLLASLDPDAGPIYAHGQHLNMLGAYREAGVALPEVGNAMDASRKELAGALVLGPPGSEATRWAKRFSERSTGLASGWMRIRGMRRRRALDRGFVISDHVDWPGILRTVEETGAEHIVCVHGETAAVRRYLSEQGHSAETWDIGWRWQGDVEEGA
jgi:putative mRNA 3-end processing factor